MRILLVSVLMVLAIKVSLAQYPTYFEERFDSAYISISPWNFGGISNRILFEVEDTADWNGINRVDFLSPVESRLGTSAINMTVAPDDTVAKKNRSEFKIFNHDPLGTEVWYGWSMKIPSDFIEETAGFQVMGQFHDYPDTINGETWASYPGRSPTISFNYGSDGTNSKLLFKYGCDTIQLNTHINKTIIDTILINKGEWNDFIFHIRWGLGSSGYVEAWHNGNHITPYNVDSGNYKFYGPNRYNTVPTYLKLGIYRNWGFTSTNSVHYDEIRIGNSMLDIALPMGISEYSNAGDWLTYFPIPTTGTIYIQSKKRVETLFIYSLTGDLIHVENLRGSLASEINIEHLIPGTYLLIVTDYENNYVTKKIVVQ